MLLPLGSLFVFVRVSLLILSFCSIDVLKHADVMFIASWWLQRSRNLLCFVALVFSLLHICHLWPLLCYLVALLIFMCPFCFAFIFNYVSTKFGPHPAPLALLVCLPGKMQRRANKKEQKFANPLSLGKQRIDLVNLG